MTQPASSSPAKPSRLVVGIDPSCACTGWAVLAADGFIGRVVEGGTIKAKEGTLAERVAQIADEVAALVQPLTDVAKVVLEFPAATRRPPSHEFGGRSVLTLPNYGVCVGAVYQALRWTVQDLLVTVAADEWTGGDIPSTEGDDHKEQRVEYVTRLYNLKPGSLGAKTYAGNVADAVLLARWGLFRLQGQP